MSFKNPYPDVEIPNVSVYDFLGSIADETWTGSPRGPQIGFETTYRALIGRSTPRQALWRRAGSVSATWSAFCPRMFRRSPRSSTARCGPVPPPPP